MYEAGTPKDLKTHMAVKAHMVVFLRKFYSGGDYAKKGVRQIQIIVVSGNAFVTPVATIMPLEHFPKSITGSVD